MIFQLVCAPRVLIREWRKSLDMPGRASAPAIPRAETAWAAHADAVDRASLRPPAVQQFAQFVDFMRRLPGFFRFLGVKCRAIVARPLGLQNHEF
jgi:hypothetical protein